MEFPQNRDLYGKMFKQLLYSSNRCFGIDIIYSCIYIFSYIVIYSQVLKHQFLSVCQFATTCYICTDAILCILYIIIILLYVFLTERVFGYIICTFKKNLALLPLVPVSCCIRKVLISRDIYTEIIDHTLHSH